MRKNTKQAYTALAVIVVVVAVIWLFKTKPTPVDNQIKNDTDQQNSTNPNPSPSPTAGSGIWTGTLKTSNTPAKGNFMLVTSSRTIYFQSSRNLSSLVGKKVDVSYQGTLQNFVVGSITPSATQ